MEIKISPIRWMGLKLFFFHNRVHHDRKIRFDGGAACFQDLQTAGSKLLGEMVEIHHPAGGAGDVYGLSGLLMLPLLQVEGGPDIGLALCIKQ